MRVCIECKWFHGQDKKPYLGPITVESKPECKHEEAVTRDMVYGTCYCHNERNDSKGCGKQGKLWTPKQS